MPVDADLDFILTNDTDVAVFHFDVFADKYLLRHPRLTPFTPYLRRVSLAQNPADCSSSGFPFRAYLPRHAFKGAFGEFGDKKPGRVDRPRHNRTSQRHRFEARFAVIRLVANQDDQLVALFASLI